MSKLIKSQGQYTVKESGENVGYEFEFIAFDSFQDAVDELGEDNVLKLVQRMTKVDANNTAREKAKVENGHSTRKPMSEEEKAEKKEQRTQDKAMLNKIKALSPAQRQALGL